MVFYNVLLRVFVEFFYAVFQKEIERFARVFGFNVSRCGFNLYAENRRLHCDCVSSLNSTPSGSHFLRI
jgi:hypothetical protein